MAAIDFPNSPTIGDLFTQGDITWQWDGTVWRGLGTTATGPAGVTISDDEPESNQVLWLDTDEEPDVPVPAGGSAGQLLAKVDGADYNTEWKDSDGVRVFADAAARGSAIPTPVEGMYTHLEDSDTLEFFNGTSFVPANNLALLSQSTPTAANTLSFSDVFSARYSNYLLVYNLTVNGAGDCTIRFRTGAGDDTSSNYNSSRLTWADASAVSRTQNANTAIFIANSTISGGTDSYAGSVLFTNPFESSVTFATNSFNRFGRSGGVTALGHDSSTSFTGFTLINTTGGQNLSGTFSIYGIRKS